MNKLEVKQTFIVKLLKLGKKWLATFDLSDYHLRVNLKSTNHQKKMTADEIRNILRVVVNFYNVTSGGIRKFHGFAARLFRLLHENSSGLLFYVSAYTYSGSKVHSFLCVFWCLLCLCFCVCLFVGFFFVHMFISDATSSVRIAR